MARFAQTLRVIATGRGRRPARDLPGLRALFGRLGAALTPREALEAEDLIWSAWMFHPHWRAAEQLELATRDIAARRYDIAETRLSLLARRDPGFAEAWNKRATLYYLQGRDAEGVEDLRRTLELEPRHFGALAHFGEILLGAGAAAEARYAFGAALALHPHLGRAREVLSL